MAINFKINGKPYKAFLENYPVDITLNTFIRQHANLPATKFMCLEGGCGVCICVIKGRHPESNEPKTWATNSCLTLLNCCDGWEIITAEGIGNRKDGYHPIQTCLAHLNGSQCGYCSPAMVMNMYGLLESKGGKVTMEEIENSFGGNICRCTGYRPILDAMKSFAMNSDYEYIECKDIEDLQKTCPKTGSICTQTCSSKKLNVSFEDGKAWIKANTLDDIFKAFEGIGGKKYMLVSGNTARGVYRRSADIEVFIDVNKVRELHTHHLGADELQLGGNLSLTETMEILEKATKNAGFEYCRKLINHIDLIANVPVRNMGTLAGNLSIKHQHKEFTSDLYIMLEAVDAKIEVAENGSKPTPMTIEAYLKVDMTKRVITKLLLRPYLENEYFFNSYKITPRAQNAHAYVNAGFLLQMSNDKVQSARICFGGINPDFKHAANTENFLIGKQLFVDQTVKDAIGILANELEPDWILPDASPEYRRTLACGLFYKFILGIAPEKLIKAEYKSGGDILRRTLSSGTQVFDTNKDKFPVTKPILKIEAMVQCSGEAFYMNDLAPIPGELWAAFVHATQANSRIAKIDSSEALNIPGVVAFYSAKHIPGENSFVVIDLVEYIEAEEIFCGVDVKYHSQPIGVIVAESLDVAKMASEKVKVLYEKAFHPVMPTLDDVFKYKATHRITKAEISFQLPIQTKSNKRLIAIKHIRGNLDIGSQYHYTMEPHTCICIPTEDGMNVYSASQWMDMTQSAIAQSLNVPKNSIFLQVRRLGGGYGGKISRSNQVACACAIASKLLNRPVRFVQSLESMMNSLGKRFSCHADYEIDVDDKGKIVKMKNEFYEDCGSSLNEAPTFLATRCFYNCYAVDENWKVNGNNVKTDAPSHTWCRAPGALEGIAMIENIMEHIACETNHDPADVRTKNLKPGSKMEQLIPDFLKSTEYAKRKIEVASFNKTNRWRKRGLGFAVMEYPQLYFGMQPATVAIYNGDGSVSISHGGIEMGQGLNTKAVQVASYVLGIPIDMIRILPSDTFIGANATVSGGGVASETVCYAVKKASEELLARMKPYRDAMKNASWPDLVQKCFAENVSLSATHTHKAGDLQTYDVWGLCLTEVEMDILTGNLLINRVDILEDTGESLSPLIDIGQIEGAFTMGIGYWLSEKLVFDRQTGGLLTNRTWNYKPPGVKDIPIDFRITLLQKSFNPAGFLRSKTTGEPASCLAIAVLFAIRNALNSSRVDAELTDKWFHLGSPCSPEDTVLNSGISVEMFGIN